MRPESDYVNAGLRTYTAATRYAEWCKPNNKKLKELKELYFAFTEKLGDWYGIPCTNDVSTTAVLCTMLIMEVPLMNDIDNIRTAPDDEGPNESEVVNWNRMYAFSALVEGVMYRLGRESKYVQEGALARRRMSWCSGNVRKKILKHMGLTPGELAEMCAERLPKQKLEELEVFATTLQVAKKLGVDYE